MKICNNIDCKNVGLIYIWSRPGDQFSVQCFDLDYPDTDVRNPPTTVITPTPVELEFFFMSEVW